MKTVTLWYSILSFLVIVMAAFLGYEMFFKVEKPRFLVGETTHGHHQIELACAVCHQSPFGGIEVLQDACMGCHGQELKIAQDSHPKSKFTDPRNADRLAQIDARYCVACHREHQPEITGTMGVTLPEDFCISCHLEIADDRPSHEGMAFDTCASAGCHNFHDNRALYEDFLLKHGHDPETKEMPVIAAMQHFVTEPANATAIPEPDYPESNYQVEQITAEWRHSAHANPDSNCSACHGEGESFTAIPDALVCADCHQDQAKGFLRGKHGMRLAIASDPLESFPLNPNPKALKGQDERLFEPMEPALGRLPFQPDAKHKTLTCNTCHEPHRYKVASAAAIDACQSCHSDEHTSAYENSPHYRLVLREQAGELPKGSGVTCATCHMPKLESAVNEGAFYTEHNNNDNLRPNEKMIRSVCMDCHGLQFSLDALADPVSVLSNFSTTPETTIPSIQMAIKREKE